MGNMVRRYANELEVEERVDEKIFTDKEDVWQEIHARLNRAYSEKREKIVWAMCDALIL